MQGYDDLISKAIASIITCIFAVIGYTFRSIKHELDAVAAKVQHMEVDLPKTYLSKADYVHAEDRLFDKLDKLDAKLDALASRLHTS